MEARKGPAPRTAGTGTAPASARDGTAPAATATSRSERALAGVLGFLGVTALGGGLEMIAFPHGNRYLPASLLDEIGLDSFALPGVVLASGFGVGSLVVRSGLRRRWRWPLLAPVERRTGRHWSWAGTVTLGVGFTAWMGLEMVLFEPPWRTEPAEDAIAAYVLEGVYGATAVVLLALPWQRPVRDALRLTD